MQASQWAMVNSGVQMTAVCDGTCGTGGDIKRAYRYINHAIGLPATLYTCNGQVSFQSVGYSAWHGSAEDNGDHMVLRFHWAGIEDLARAVVVNKVAVNRYEGEDYCGRPITMVFLRQYHYCEVCRVWHYAPDRS